MTVEGSPQLSIVVPVYNGAKTLASCLHSVERAVAALGPQRRDRVEVIVCDNHSTDDSARLAREARFACLAQTVQPPEHLANRTDNWRYGLSAGKGDWLLMLHADDALVEEALAVWLDAIESPLSRNVGFVTARHRNFVESPDDLHAARPRAFPAPSLLSGRLLVRWVLPLMCPFLPFVLVRRVAYEAVGGFDNRLELTQDWDLWIRLCRNHDVLYVPSVVGAFRVHPTSAGYQRLNMAEYLRLMERLEIDRSHHMPFPVRRLVRRCVDARVTHVLQADHTEEAQLIRERAADLVGRRGSGSQSWLQVSHWITSAMLYGLRAAGAVRAGFVARSGDVSNEAGARPA